MADVWLPGAWIDRGRNAGYMSGRSDMRAAVAHYTVGSDSRNVGRDGYFSFLVHRDASRENGCTQYCEVDAISWHAADANPWGPGVEWERMVTGGVNAEGLSEAEPLTENQIAWGARLVDYFAEWGIPAQLYDGPRYGAGGWFGWVNHQAIDSQRSDGLTRAEWDAICGGAGPAPSPPTTTRNREALEMFACYLAYINWVDVYYHGVQVESYENAGPHNVFGIGPALTSLMESGVHVTTITDRTAYERDGGLRDQLLAGSRAALAYLDSPL